MKRMVLNAVLLAGLGFVSTAALAREEVKNPTKKPSKTASFKNEAGDCASPIAQFDMDINNVRARLLTGGDMWWNLSEARYQVPKSDGTGASLNALFAGAIWITGFDAGGNLKCAAQRYRQGGDDFWPGPVVGGTVDKATCNKYDRFFNVYGANIEKAQAAYMLKGSATTLADIPKDVLAWPGKDNPYLASDPSLVGETFIINDNMAPFKDVDNDGVYDPLKGDYPYIPCRNGEAEAYADQMIFWCFNDVGNLHTESNGQAIGVQINALAFAFQTTDEINNMTFYKYEIINKSSNPLRQTYISQWSDPDLGCFSNDRVGCDTTRNLGIVYDGETPDIDCQGVAGYGSEHALIGIDFFEGPLSDSGQQLGLSSFVYFINGAAFPMADPSSAAGYRNYMTGFWNDGTPFTQGGTGYNTGSPTKFIFPGNPIDPNAWSDHTSGQQSGDRRMVQTSGPFTLLPGAPQFVTVGVVFVRPPGGVGVPPNFATTIGPADDKAQALFNTCFKLVDGPRAPTLNIRELSNSLIINFINEVGTNNFGEGYDQVDGSVAQAIYTTAGTNGDSTYTFEGYKLYQVANGSISATDLDDPTKARLVAQVDVKNGVSKVVNYVKDATLGLFVPVLKVDGKNEGVTTSFKIETDLFATGTSNKLVNHKTYYYTAIAYAHNNYKTYDPGNPLAGGQLTPYLQGRSNFRIYSAVPHITTSRNGGTVLNAKWGEGVEVKRIEGKGNGGNNLNLTAETVEKILNSGFYAFSDTLTYTKGFDPIGFKVTDPVVLKEADFEIQFVETPGTNIGTSTRWFLHNITDNDTIWSERTLDRPYEQQIVSGGNEYGFSIKLGTPAPVYNLPANYPQSSGSPARSVYGVSQSSITYQIPTERWLSFVQDQGTTTPTNWIRSGTDYYDPASPSPITKNASLAFDDNWYYTAVTPPTSPDVYSDPDEVFENILEGTWAPYCLTPNYAKKNLSTQELTDGKPPFVYGPGFKWRNYATSVPPQNTLDRLASVDIVITPDKSKWSRCIVFETGEDEGINQGALLSPNGANSRKGQIRMARSKNWNNPNTRDYLVDDPSDIGRSWFPGYAINIETGERLNIAFGESSDMGDQNGRDMLWNPTDKVFGPITFPGQMISQLPYFGGKHFIYVMETKYDEGDAAQQLLTNNFVIGTSNPFIIPVALTPFYRSLMWTSIPYVTPGYSFAADANGVKYIPPSEVTVKLRVEKPYNRMATISSSFIDSLPRYQFSTKGMGATEKEMEVAKNALDLIRIVPNPYLAYSEYETDANSNKVKITNLPNVCNITIYALDGTLIRRLSRAIDIDPATNKRIEISDGASVSDINVDNSVEWDLKNDKSITISSGIYLFHVEAPGIGQRTLKWFGAIRPSDTSNF
ncbi:MAG: hypothetical protein KIS94_02760 [Chitinophagales bacterium]|nr:hypothetical protein [Chitinophagales bacterium]